MGGDKLKNVRYFSVTQSPRQRGTSQTPLKNRDPAGNSSESPEKRVRPRFSIARRYSNREKTFLKNLAQLHYRDRRGKSFLEQGQSHHDFSEDTSAEKSISDFNLPFIRKSLGVSESQMPVNSDQGSPIAATPLGRLYNLSFFKVKGTSPNVHQNRRSFSTSVAGGGSPILGAKHGRLSPSPIRQSFDSPDIHHQLNHHHHRSGRIQSKIVFGKDRRTQLRRHDRSDVKLKPLDRSPGVPILALERRGISEDIQDVKRDRKMLKERKWSEEAEEEHHRHHHTEVVPVTVEHGSALAAALGVSRSELKLKKIAETKDAGAAEGDFSLSTEGDERVNLQQLKVKIENYRKSRKPVSYQMNLHRAMEQDRKYAKDYYGPNVY